MVSTAAASTAPTPMHSPAHRRLRQALRRKRCTATSLFTRPAWPRRALRPHDHQRAPRKLSAPPIILPRRYAPASCVQSSNLTLPGCQLLPQGRPGVRLARHQRRRQALRRQHDCQRGLRKLSDHAVAFPLPSPPFASPLLLVRASFANKENSTARGWSLGA